MQTAHHGVICKRCNYLLGKVKGLDGNIRAPQSPRMVLCNTGVRADGVDGLIKSSILRCKIGRVLKGEIGGTIPHVWGSNQATRSDNADLKNKPLEGPIFKAYP